MCIRDRTAGTWAHGFTLPDTPLHTKVTFRKTMAIESQNTLILLPFHRSISYIYPSLHTTAHSARRNASHPSHTRYTAHDSLISVRAVLRQTPSFGSQSPWFFWRSLSVCNDVSGNVNPCAQVPAISRKGAHSFHTCLIYFFGRKWRWINKRKTTKWKRKYSIWIEAS